MEKAKQKNYIGDRYGYIVNQRKVDTNGNRYTEPVARFQTLGDAMDCCECFDSMQDGRHVFYVFAKHEGRRYEVDDIA